MTTEKQDISTKNSLQASLANVKGWFFFVIKKWWLIVLICFCGGLLGFWAAYTEKAKYKSHLTFALEEDGGGMGGAISLAAEFGFNVGGTKNIFEGDNILTLLTSKRIVQRVLLSVDTLSGKPITLADYYTKISADSTKKNTTPTDVQSQRLAKVNFPAGQNRNKFSYLQDSVLKVMYQKITGGALVVRKPDKKLNLYEVTFTSYNERFSKIFTDRLINEATVFYVEIKTKKSKETLDLLEARVAQLKGSLNTAISNRAVIQDANVNPAFQQAQAQLQQRQVDVSTYSGAYGELYKNLEMARYQYLRDIPLLQIIDAADYPMDRIKKGKLITAVTYAFFAGFLIVFILSVIFIFRSETQASRQRQPAPALPNEYPAHL